MCGIHAVISTTNFQAPSESLCRLLHNRGPDAFGHKQAQLPNENGTSYYISLMSTVLALRGEQVTLQPFHDASSGSLFCWNGEAWTIARKHINDNDGNTVFRALLEASSAARSPTEATTSILKVLQAISGPFAFVFFDNVNRQMYLGRDRLGRRSLLYKYESCTTTLEFASVSDPLSRPWQEVDADAIYQINLKDTYISQQLSQSYQELSSVSFVQVFTHVWQSPELDPSFPSLGVFNKQVPEGSPFLDLRSRSVRQLHAHLKLALEHRVLHVPRPPVGQSMDQCSNVRVAVLFSGGLDCTVIARLIHDILPLEEEIDLINVAFENPRVVSAAKHTKSKRMVMEGKNDGQSNPIASKSGNDLVESPFENCPDRLTGRRSHTELQSQCPTRLWRFVAVNVPYLEVLKHRPLLTDLIYPHNTEMDLSIACALYFSARGSGVAESTTADTITYTTTARVLLSGLGADELFAGYTRHATAFQRSSFAGLFDEMKLDIDRLGKRNLGRDDRAISHWGREVRYPYLDESLVKWAVQCPIWEKTGFQSDAQQQEIPAIEPGKKVLRLLAYGLGMQSVAKEKKRAIQFGARSAKMETGNTKGTSLIG